MVDTEVTIARIWSVTGSTNGVAWSLVVAAVFAVVVLAADTVVTFPVGVVDALLAVLGIGAGAVGAGWVAGASPGFAFVTSPVLVALTVAVLVPRGVRLAVETVRVFGSGTVMSTNVKTPVATISVVHVAGFGLSSTPLGVTFTAVDHVGGVCCAVVAVVVAWSSTAHTAVVTWSDVVVTSLSGPVAVADAVSVFVP